MSEHEREISFLLSPRTIRARAEAILELAKKGGTHFSFHPERLEDVAKRVVQVTLSQYPELHIPFHSRWGHFQVGKRDRYAQLCRRLEGLSPEDRAKSELDLVVVSVLLDAGSGPGWKFVEPETGETYARSEGLAVASFHMFVAGALSSDPSHPYQVDAKGLEKLSAETLARGFQVSASNPLAGFEGRLGLLRSLSRALAAQPRYFGQNPPRPGGLLDHFRREATSSGLQAERILDAVQRGLGPIWPGRVSIEGFNLGDVWPYPPLGSGIDGLVPFHKLSQWLSYSIIEPLERAGIGIHGTDDLTGLAEYRNGGLFVDARVIELRDPSLAHKAHAPGSPLVVEWRALTVALLERTADLVRAKLGKTRQDFPLGRVLEGGTWHAGRQIAAELRPGGGPPLQIESDGTVF